MPILSNIKCDCGRPATCKQCNSCVLHCLCPTPEESEMRQRRLVAYQIRYIIEHIERNVGSWVWKNIGTQIVWDGRLTAPGCVGFGEYLAMDSDGKLWFNRHWNDGRGMTEYNYGARKYNGDYSEQILAAFIKLNSGVLLTLDEKSVFGKESEQ